MNALCVLLAGVVCACGSTDIIENRVLQAAQENGEIAYYRLTIIGDADMAKTHYRAGLYDAEALDALLSSPSTDNSEEIDNMLLRHRHEAVDQAASRFYGLLGSATATQDQIDEAGKRMAMAMQSPYLLAAQGGGDVSPPRRKYAIIFSALASVVEEAIAGIVEENETTQTVMAAAASVKRDDFIKASADGGRLQNALAKLQAVYASASQLTADDPDRESKVKDLLSDVESVEVR